MDWDYGNGQYLVDANLAVGDGSTSTHMTTMLESIYFSDGLDLNPTTNATFQQGNIEVNEGANGSVVSLKNATQAFLTAGTWLLYGSTLEFRDHNKPRHSGGTFTSLNSTIRCTWTRTAFDARFETTGGTQNFTDTFFTDWGSLLLGLEPNTFTRVRVTANTGIVLANPASGTITLTGLAIDVDNTDYQVKPSTQTTLETIDPLNHVINTFIATREDNAIFDQYTCNIHVADRDGNDLQSVTVTVEDIDTTEEFSVSTDANGDIAEQVLNYKSWTGTSEILKDFTPHKFTISKAGYETLVLEAVTVDHPLVWHLELQRSASINSGLIG